MFKPFGSNQFSAFLLRTSPLPQNYLIEVYSGTGGTTVAVGTTVLSGILQWYAAWNTANNPANHDPVGSAGDMSGNGFDLFATSGYRPSYETVAINNHPVWHFGGQDNGSLSGMWANDNVGYKKGTIHDFWVAKFADSNGGRPIFGYPSSATSTGTDFRYGFDNFHPVPDPVTPSKGQLGGLFWFKPSTLSGKTPNADIGTWLDSSGSSHHAYTIGSTGFGNRYATNVLNGTAVVQFSSSDGTFTGGMRIPHDNSLQVDNLTVFMLLRGYGTLNNELLENIIGHSNSDSNTATPPFDWAVQWRPKDNGTIGTGAWGQNMCGAGQNNALSFGGTVGADSAFFKQFDSWNLMMYETSTGNIWLNGTQRYTGTQNGTITYPHTTGEIRIGINVDEFQILNAQVAEIWGTVGSMTPTNRRVVENQFASEYNLSFGGTFFSGTTQYLRIDNNGTQNVLATIAQNSGYRIFSYDNISDDLYINGTRVYNGTLGGGYTYSGTSQFMLGRDAIGSNCIEMWYAEGIRLDHQASVNDRKFIHQYLADFYGFSIDPSEVFNTAATFVGSQLGSLFFGENISYTAGSTSPFGTAPWNTGTLQIKIYGLGSFIASTAIPEAKLNPYDQLRIRYGLISANAQDFSGTFILPDIPLGNATTILYSKFNFVGVGPPTPVDQLYETYRDPAFGSLAGRLDFRHPLSDTCALSDTAIKTFHKVFTDSLAISEGQRQIRRRYPIDYLPLSEFVSYRNIRHGTITDWNFVPDYVIMFDDIGNGTNFATTNWSGRVRNYNSIRKSVKHWTGDFEIGQWNPEIVDEINELYGSIFGSFDGRLRSIVLRARINDSPLTYTTQMTGVIGGIEWGDGVANFAIKDKAFDIADRDFVYDYANLGSHVNGKEWGRVTKISGTQIMFEDRGDVKWIQRKTEGQSVLTSIFGGIVDGVLGFVGGGWVGAGIGFVNGLTGGLTQPEKVTGGYYSVDDYNVIPDDLIQSGAKLKFYGGSINGQATNAKGVLFGIPDRTIINGTFIFGIHGTIGLDSISNIFVGDYIYVRKPIVFQGSPKKVIYALLTGSNISYPYNALSQITGTVLTSGGVGIPPYDVVNDFSPNWDSELDSIGLMTVGKLLNVDESSPFDEVKSLCADLLLEFFINEDNQLDVRSIRPRALLGGTAIATYSQNANILDGFKWNSNIDDAAAGIRIYYDFLGQGIGAFKDGYNRLKELPFGNPLVGVKKWLEVTSKWLQLPDDVDQLAYRYMISQERGVNKITLPTTLYGITQQLGDVISVTHRTGSITSRMFQIDSYEKSNSESRVVFEASDVQKTFGVGYDKWCATSIPVDTTSESGNSSFGIVGSLTKIGSINGTLFGRDTSVSMYQGLSVFSYRGRLIAFGSTAYNNVEICYLQRVFPRANGNSEILLQRGVLNTIARTYFPDESLYDLGNPIFDNQNRIIGCSGTNFRLATCLNINTRIGTSFNFF